MARPYHNTNSCYPYPIQLPHKKTTYYDNNIISYPSCPSFLPPQPQYPYYQQPYYVETPSSCHPCHYNPYPNYYPNYLDPTQDEFAPPREVFETDAVEHEDCDSIPLKPPSIHTSPSAHDPQDCHKKQNGDGYDSDDTSTIDSGILNDDDNSIGSHSTANSSKNKPKDVFFLRIPRMKNKNFHITMNQNDCIPHPRQPAIHPPTPYIHIVKKCEKM
jgi:hypothetical protein